MAEAVLVGEEREERGGHSLAYPAIGFGDLEGSGLCVDHRPEVSGRKSKDVRCAFLAAESVFAYTSDTTPVTLRVLGSREGLRACNTRHEPSPQSPPCEMATFLSRVQALALDADVKDFNWKA